ncbi:MAG: hypothetical protein M3Y70_00030 [Pseudomonadota bacterium]|nr:hypothetical protein [Pseudomonadota bacterium]
MKYFRVSAIALAVAATAAPGASHSAGKDKLPQLYIDVATHDMAGMPALGRGAMDLFGKRTVDYGMTRYPGMPGQYMDIALYTGANPAPDATQAIPSGLRLGKNLPLLPPPPEREIPPNDGGVGYEGIADGGEHTTRILIYWGCGDTVRKGQPREIRIRMKDGKADITGSMPKGRNAPVKAIDPGREFALWPNARSNKAVSDKASLVGEHQVSGAGVPESMQFAIAQAHDFMPKIELSSSGGGDSATQLEWKAVDRATGYFINSMGQRDDAMVMWSSAEMAEPGAGLIDYLPEATVARWIREKVLLSPQATRCSIPAGIFGEGMGMTQMIAYGPEKHLTWPARPAKAAASWQPDWGLRLRTKSTVMVVGGVGGSGGSEQAPKPKIEPKKLLKGLFGR